MTATVLPTWSGVLAVCAHPDDESFGLGAVRDTFAAAGSRLAVVCFTRGEASTLHGVSGDLATLRERELADAGAQLGVEHLELLDYADGALATQPLGELAGHVARVARSFEVAGLVVFDHSGITGHPDHQRATDTALAAARTLGVPVLAWTLPAAVAEALNQQFGTGLVRRSPDALDIALPVDRRRQLQAIECHRSQSRDKPRAPAAPPAARRHRVAALPRRLTCGLGPRRVRDV